jgi:hypothetical protein
MSTFIQLKMFGHGLKNVNTLMPVQNLYESISRRIEAVLKAKCDVDSICSVFITLFNPNTHTHGQYFYRVRGLLPISYVFKRLLVSVLVRTFR